MCCQVLLGLLLFRWRFEDWFSGGIWRSPIVAPAGWSSRVFRNGFRQSGEILRAVRQLTPHPSLSSNWSFVQPFLQPLWTNRPSLRQGICRTARRTTRPTAPHERFDKQLQDRFDERFGERLEERFHTSGWTSSLTSGLTRDLSGLTSGLASGWASVLSGSAGRRVSGWVSGSTSDVTRHHNSRPPPLPNRLPDTPSNLSPNGSVNICPSHRKEKPNHPPNNSHQHSSTTSPNPSEHFGHRKPLKSGRLAEPHQTVGQIDRGDVGWISDGACVFCRAEQSRSLAHLRFLARRTFSTVFEGSAWRAHIEFEFESRRGERGGQHF